MSETSTESGSLVSKVLVLEDTSQHSDTIKQFCTDNSLVPLKVRKNRLLSVLRANIDLGAILFSENYGGTPEETAEIAMRIHTIRPELPIFLRRECPGESGMAGVDPSLARIMSGAYSIQDPDTLKRLVDQCIFNRDYPCELVRGISEITERVLINQFPTFTTKWDPPTIVRDRLIFGEVLSMIPLESSWCRGYMMVQAEEQPILDALNSDPRFPESNFREVNSMLGEITNLVWGSFKNRYIGDSQMATGRVQVPLVVNHKHKYISFGAEDPQLCFLYTLTDDVSGRVLRLQQRFIFNLNWAPEDFKEIVHDAEQFVDSGEIELF